MLMNATELGWTARFLLRKLRRRQLSREFVDWLSWKEFWRNYHNYNSMSSNGQQANWSELYPCLGDNTAETEIEPSYFYQDSWAFERIVQARPQRHVDVGSDHKYVALLSKVVPVTMIDIRPLSLEMDSIKFQKGSILDLPFEDASVPSVSSLCVVEHIGLGRYGDQLDPNGTQKAIAELKRIISPGGSLYISLPLDDENRIYFNAHRAFVETHVKKLFDPFHVEESRYIYGNRFLETPLSGFGVGCYHLRAPNSSSD